VPNFDANETIVKGKRSAMINNDPQRSATIGKKAQQARLFCRSLGILGDRFPWIVVDPC
jgi:hypothetical protein